MSSITENKARIKAFTSSEIFKLLINGKGPGGIGDKAQTYIKEKNLEAKLGRSIKTDAYSKDIAWGGFLEPRVESLIDFGWKLVSNETVVHPKYSFWAGSKDLEFAKSKVGEIKCYQPKNAALYADALMTQDIDVVRKECPEEYWQGVSNAIINEVKTVALFSYIPYQSELAEIREMAEMYDGPDQWKFRFIAESPDSSLAYIPDGGYYKNLTSFEFEVPQEDVDLLTNRVVFCASLLVDPAGKPLEKKIAAPAKATNPDANALSI